MKKGKVSLILGCMLGAAVFTSAVSADQTSNTLTAAYTYKAPLDPFEYATEITRTIVEPLFRYNGLAEAEEQVVPMLAESYEISEDGLTWTFTLRDAKFSDGKQVTADDVVGSLDYALTTAIGAGNYAGFSAEALDEKTVAITVPVAADYIKYYIGTLPIIDAEKFAEDGADVYFENLVGTGPFVLQSYDEATGVAELTANDDYWGGKPALDAINFRYVPDANTVLIALQKGEIDYAPITSATFNQANKDSNLKTQFSAPVLGNYIIFNTENELVADQKLRQAILYAVDTDGVALMSEVPGNYQVPHGFFQEEWGMDKPDGFTEYSYDPDKAMELLAEAGIETPIDLGEIGITQDQKAMWEAIQQNLADVGINISVSSLETTIWLDKLWKGDFAIAALTGADMVSLGYANVCDIFQSAGIEYGYNYSRYADEELDGYLMAAEYTLDHDEANENFGKALNIINDQALWGIIDTYGKVYAMNKELNVNTDDTVYLGDASWN